MLESTSLPLVPSTLYCGANLSLKNYAFQKFEGQRLNAPHGSKPQVLPYVSRLHLTLGLRGR